MTRICRRIVSRIPAGICRSRSEAFLSCKIMDYSRKGFCCAAQSALEPQSHVFILPLCYVPGTFGPEAFRSYKAVIRWCKPCGMDSAAAYLMGIELLAKSHELFTGEDQEICALCGRSFSDDALSVEPMGAPVCFDCLKHLRSIGNAGVFSSIRRFVRDEDLAGEGSGRQAMNAPGLAAPDGSGG